MKKIAFIILSTALILLGCSKSDDLPTGSIDELQLKSSENKTEITTRTFYYWTPVNCDGNLDGWLEGELTFRIQMHHSKKKGNWDHWTRLSGTLKGGGSFEGEEFKFNYQDITYYTEGGSWDNADWTSFTYHFVAIGNKGSRILNAAEILFPNQPGDPNTFEVIPIKSKCHLK